MQQQMSRPATILCCEKTLDENFAASVQSCQFQRLATEADTVHFALHLPLCPGFHLHRFMRKREFDDRDTCRGVTQGGLFYQPATTNYLVYAVQTLALALQTLATRTRP